MKKLRTFDEYEEKYYRENPEEVDIYIEEMFTAYAEDGNTGAFLSSLRMVAKVKGITDIADEIGMSRRGLQKALSTTGNPHWETINGVMQAMGYRLTPEPLRELREREGH